MTEETSSGSSTGSSISTSTVPAQLLPILDQFAGMAAQYAGDLMNWANNTFANTSNITNANMGALLAQAGTATQMAQNAADRYQNVFQPEEDQLVKDANTYAGAPRIQQAQGMAEAGVGDAMDAARQNTLRDLQQYGIDPSAGRYASLDRTMNAQEGAAKAAAGTMAQLNTEQIGRNLRQQAIAVGQQYPGQAVNELNTGIQGVTAAENAVLANANTGAAMMSLPANMLSTLKYPPMANNSTSQQRSQNQGQKNTPDKPQQDPNAAAARAGAIPNPNAPKSQPLDPNTFKGGNSEPFIPNPGDPNDADYFGPNSFGGEGGGGQNPFAGLDNTPAQPAFDPSQFPGLDQMSQFPPDIMNNNSDMNPELGNGANFDPTQNAGTPFNGDNGGFAIPPSGDNPVDDSGDYAQGGEVNDQTQGGFVSQNMSPSQGQNVDDVPAHLNAEEFVMPRDVARWKGEEFFHKLIAQSRQARIQAQQTVGPTYDQAA